MHCTLSDGSHPDVPVPIYFLVLPYFLIEGKVAYDKETKEQAILGADTVADNHIGWNFIGYTP